MIAGLLWKENPEEASGDVGESKKATSRLMLAFVDFGPFLDVVGWAVDSSPLPPTPPSLRARGLPAALTFEVAPEK